MLSGKLDSESRVEISHLVVVGDVDGLVSRRAEHAGLPDGRQLLGPHQAEDGPLRYVHHGGLARSQRRGRRAGGTGGRVRVLGGATSAATAAAKTFIIFVTAFNLVKTLCKCCHFMFLSYLFIFAIILKLHFM